MLLVIFSSVMNSIGKKNIKNVETTSHIFLHISSSQPSLVHYWTWASPHAFHVKLSGALWCQYPPATFLISSISSEVFLRSVFSWSSMDDSSGPFPYNMTYPGSFQSSCSLNHVEYWVFALISVFFILSLNFFLL